MNESEAATAHGRLGTKRCASIAPTRFAFRMLRASARVSPLVMDTAVIIAHRTASAGGHLLGSQRDRPFPSSHLVSDDCVLGTTVRLFLRVVLNAIALFSSDILPPSVHKELKDAQRCPALCFVRRPH